MNDIISTAHNIVTRLHNQKNNPDKQTMSVPDYAITEVLRLLASKSTTNTLHVFPVLDQNLNSRAFELQLWRQLARRGVVIERIYIVPYKGFARSAIETSVSEDEKAGISSTTIALSEVSQNRTVTLIRQMLLCDNRTVLRSEFSPTQGGTHNRDWVLSTREHEVSSAREMWSTLQELVADRPLQEHLVNLEEPLVLSADLLNGVANVLCSGDHVDRTNCSWYHGVWQYMRLLDLVSTPTWHDTFYREAFESFLATNKTARVLISGTADYSLLAYLLSATQSIGASPQISVLDQCATPLFACRWLGKQAGITINTVQADIFDATNVFSDKFNLIASDAFLTRFDAGTVDKVLSTWASLLSNSTSQIITTVRMQSHMITVRNEEKAITDFIDRAQSRLLRWQQYLGTPASVLLAAFETYARKMVSNQIGNSENLRQRLETKGLKIVKSEMADVPGELYPTVYIRLIASLQGISNITGE